MAGPFDPPSSPFPHHRGMMPKPPAQPQLVTVTATGQSGRTYEFQIHPIGTAYHERPGIYMFLSRGPDGKWRIAYIGESGDFNSRLNTELKQHHRWQSICAERATHIGTLHVPGVLANRETMETDLIRAYNPPCNRQ